jgi:hypothetical protein
VRLAARGARESERGVVAIADPGLVQQFAVRAKGVHVRSLVFALLLTVFALLLP